MDGKATISKNKIFPPSQDFEFLRKEGLKHIEGLSNEIWTDYNTHDPGITILEALCYAVTELGYRCGFDMKDLLTDEQGDIYKSQNFFTAKNILTNNPQTINDFRKLLIDLEGVHNAFLLTGDKKPDPLKKELPYILNGLYRVLLDLDNDNRYGDLNGGEVIIGNPKATTFAEGDFVLSVSLPAWKNADFKYAAAAGNKSKIQSADVAVSGRNWTCTLTLTDASTCTFDISISKFPESGKVGTADLQAVFDNKEFVASIFEIYLGKIEKARRIVRTAIKTLQEHRNLCEDFAQVTTVDSEEIAFCFDVDVRPAADIEKVQAEMFYAIENYLNPSVEFYSLKELLDKKIPVDEIFEGTVLHNGFVDTAQLEKTQLRSVIHTSDIINLLMDIDGVLAVRNFLMTKYDAHGVPVPDFIGMKWCMDISPFHKPVLSTDRSKILLFKNQFPFIARYDEVYDTILLLHALRSASKLKGAGSDIPIAGGRKRDTESFRPVQYDFPQTYGIGEFGLPINATRERIAEQRQLKAYLMFYEQLLADFLSQFSNSWKLFSIEEIKQTYHAQFLKGIKDMDAVYNVGDPPGKQEDLLAVQDSTATSKNGWQSLYEPKELFEDRRNRFLDHMLARFAESFNDYAMLMYSINYNEKTEEKISFSELTEAKIRTLSQYDILSSQRGKAYNYFPQNDDFTIAVSALWDTDNVSGLEKKVSFLTGIKDYTRRFLYCIKNDETDSMEEVVVEGNTDECNDPVGMHLIEHILLRPRDAAFAPMQGCDDGCDCRCESEPYSFRASVVLPYWPGHFDNMAFRQYFENKIREEAPAHIMLKICWLNNELMREFEVKYKLWIETLASYAADQKSGLNAFRKANDSMVDILSRLHSEYPKATLHNCNENKDGRNPVVLGKTVLGTFKNS